MKFAGTMVSFRIVCLVLFHALSSTVQSYAFVGNQGPIVRNKYKERKLRVRAWSQKTMQHDDHDVSNEVSKPKSYKDYIEALRKNLSEGTYGTRGESWSVLQGGGNVYSEFSFFLHPSLANHCHVQCLLVLSSGSSRSLATTWYSGPRLFRSIMAFSWLFRP